jgi:hypothetical protein
MTAAPLSPTFDESVRTLTTHPVVVEMAIDLHRATPAMLATLTTDEGAPTTQFMTLAADRFAERTDGQRGQFLGTVSRAVLAALAVLRAPLPEQPQPPEIAP